MNRLDDKLCSWDQVVSAIKPERAFSISSSPSYEIGSLQDLSEAIMSAKELHSMT